MCSFSHVLCVCVCCQDREDGGRRRGSRKYRPGRLSRTAAVKDSETHCAIVPPSDCSRVVAAEFEGDSGRGVLRGRGRTDKSYFTPSWHGTARTSARLLASWSSPPARRGQPAGCLPSRRDTPTAAPSMRRAKRMHLTVRYVELRSGPCGTRASDAMARPSPPYPASRVGLTRYHEVACQQFSARKHPLPVTAPGKKKGQKRPPDNKYLSSV
ncbi:hypothetical protein GGR56DRAFT_222849 [Xylariaceae sp. FL0804]|nr:hypothetical protein GGR56DRAFT_222849 [Xylariaceae sp. FL0804]